MPVLVHRSLTRRRVLTAVGLVSVVAVIGVQAASGARTHAAGLVGTTGATGSSDTTGALPADQPALDTAADDAQSVAGSAYYTDAVVNDTADTVDVYLDSAPQSVIDQLQEMHPGTYVIHNDAAHPRSELLDLQRSLMLPALKAQGIDVVSVSPTPSGDLSVGVTSATDVQSAQSVLTAVAQSTLAVPNTAGIVKVYSGAEPVRAEGYRYNENIPFNGGDFIVSVGTDRFDNNNTDALNCTSGIGVHKTGDTTLTYMLTAAHCDWPLGSSSTHGVGQLVQQGYYRDDTHYWYGGSSAVGIGNVKYQSDDSSGNTSNDAELIPTGNGGTGYDVFKSGWNSSEIGANTGVAENHSGDHVCESGAVTGETCGLVVEKVQSLQKVSPPGWPYSFYSVMNSAYNPNNTSWIASADGDSGGPVYWKDSSGNIVDRGIVEGGASTVSCSLISPPTGWSGTCSHILWFEGMDTLDGAFNVTPNHN